MIKLLVFSAILICFLFALFKNKHSREFLILSFVLSSYFLGPFNIIFYLKAFFIVEILTAALKFGTSTRYLISIIFLVVSSLQYMLGFDKAGENLALITYLLLCVTYAEDLLF